MTNAKNIETTAVAVYDKDTNVFSMAVDMSELIEQIAEEYKREIIDKLQEKLELKRTITEAYKREGNEKMHQCYDGQAFAIGQIIQELEPDADICPF